MRTRNAWHAYRRVCRMEYLRLEGPGAFVPLFLAAGSLNQLLDPHLLVAYVIFMLSFFSGFMANSLADVEVDRRFKAHIAEAVDFLGKRTLAALVVGHVALALALTGYLAHALGEPLVLAAVSVALFFGLAYSLQPFHFKVKGLLYFSLQVGSLIMVSLIYYVVAGVPPPAVLFVFASFLVAHQGIELVNQAQDYLVDRACGLRTPAVRWGVRPTLRAAFVTTAAGILLGIGGFYFLYAELPPLALFGTELEPAALYAVSASIMAAGYVFPLVGIRRFLQIAARIPQPERIVPLIQRHLDYPRWQMTGIVSVTLATSLYFAWRLAVP